MIKHIEDFLLELGKRVYVCWFTTKSNIRQYTLLCRYMYLNYYEKEVNTEEDNNPIGIVLCAEKDEIVAEYSLEGLNNNIFASQYTYCIPDKEQLIKEVEKVLRENEE